VLVADIHHVSLNVLDTERSLAFYSDVLGLGKLARPDFDFNGAWLDAGNGRQIHLIETDSVPADVGQHFAFLVDDIDHVVEVVRAAGYEIPDAKTVRGGVARQTFVRDPDGNRVEFNQPAA
jgi:catechol 2,3-dioxygenase-like lactoylglutathione lyase family enzyme